MVHSHISSLHIWDTVHFEGVKDIISHISRTYIGNSALNRIKNVIILRPMWQTFIGKKSQVSKGYLVHSIVRKKIYYYCLISVANDTDVGRGIQNAGLKAKCTTQCENSYYKSYIVDEWTSGRVHSLYMMKVPLYRLYTKPFVVHVHKKTVIQRAINLVHYLWYCIPDIQYSALPM